jgi:RNA polymerase sigma factor (sigma-70 family)
MERAMVADSILLNQYARKGDPEAFAELVRRYSGLVYGTCFRTTGNPQDAEDVAQECFLELARKAKRVDASLPGWLHQVARHKSIDLVRRETRRKSREDGAAYQTNAELDPTWAEILPYVDHALSALPETLKIVILLHYFDGLSQKDVAERLGISQATVSRDLNRSVSELRKNLAKAGIVISVAVLASLLASNKASAAPNTLIVSATKVGLSGVGRAGPGILASAARVPLPHKILAAGILILSLAALTLSVIHSNAGMGGMRSNGQRAMGGGMAGGGMGGVKGNGQAAGGGFVGGMGGGGMGGAKANGQAGGGGFAGGAKQN